MKTSKKIRAFFAVMLAVTMMVSMMPASMKMAKAADAKYYVTVFTTTTNFYAAAANVAQETQSVYFATSEDGSTYHVLNNGVGVVFAKSGSFQITNPLIFNDRDKFVVTAPDATASKGVHIFTSANGVHFYDDTLKAEAEVEYNLEEARIEKTDIQLLNGGKNILESDPNITLGNELEISAEQYKFYQDKLGTVKNNGMKEMADIEVEVGTTAADVQKKLNEKNATATATYTDGSETVFNVDWTGALDKVDFSKVGEYTVEGKVKQRKYENKLKELNGSNLPEDDPDNANPDFPDNYDVANKKVYFDSTKFIEGLADPEIYWDEETGYYYCTGSYFPQDGDAIDEKDNTQQYDRVTLRRSRTLEGLQTRHGDEGQVTVWKAGNQPWYNGDTDEKGAAGHRYIWAPEIHRVGDYWCIFFTESHSSLFDIYCHVLVLPGDQDPYDTALTESGEESQWTDYKMQIASGVNSAYNSLNTAFCLDMTCFQEESTGKYYVIWAGKPTASPGGSSTDLFIAELNPDKPWEVISSETRLTCSQYGWERVRYCVNEGPTVLQHDGNIFVAYSVSGTGSEYAIGMVSTKNGEDLLDINNWTKNPYPLYSSRDAAGEEGPGHNSFTVDEEGNIIFVYHARPTSHNYQMCGSDVNGEHAQYNAEPLNDPCRHARLKRVHWAADGTPILKMTYEEELDPSNATVTAKVIVKAKAPVKVSSIKVTPSSKTLYVGKTVSLKAAVSPSNAANKAVSYTSSKTKVAKVDSKGKVTALSKGTATITVAAKDGSGKKATVKITVKEGTLSVSGNKSVKVKKKITLKAAAKNLNSTKISWKVTSGSKNIKLSKTSGSKITVTGKKKGTAKIKVTCGYKSVTKSIKVTK